MLTERNNSSSWSTVHFAALATLAMVLALAVAGYGQVVNATLSGSVTDPTGAVIPEASVTATNVATGISTKTTTNASGNYIFPSLPPGTYTVHFEKNGFKATVLTGIILQVDQKAALNAKLEVGAVSQQVSVTSRVPLVNTTTGTLGTVIDAQKTVELPLNLREYGSLATLVPGTVTDNGGFASDTFGSPFSQTSYNSNGNRSASNSFLIDGIESRNLTFGGFGLQPPPDAVQEFNLEQNIYNAAFGLAAGSTINLTTKSGTNQIHGTVYEFLRNSGMDARNFFVLNQTNPFTGAPIPGSARPEFRRNQFGFALGGPIKKDKTFWFVNYEGLRRIEGGSSLSTVPTPSELNGDLSPYLTGTTVNLCGSGGPANLNFDSGQMFNPATLASITCPAGSAKAGSSVLVGTPIAGNIITSTDGVAKHVIGLSGFPAPNYPASALNAPNFILTSPITQQDNSFIVRIDHHLSDKDQLFARYMFGQSTWNDPYSGYSALPGFGDKLYYRGQNAAVGWTHTISPTLLSEARVGFQRNWDNNNCASCPRAPDFMSSFGIKNLTGFSSDTIGFPIFGFVNFPNVGDSNYRPVISPDMVESYGDHLTWIHGPHTLTFGGDLDFWQVLHEEAPFSPHGQIYFNGQFSGLAGELPGAALGSDLADFLTGYPDNAARTLRFEDTNQRGGKFWDFFAQDDWKATSRLTLNLGLRWEYRGWPTDTRDNFVSFIPTAAPFSGYGNALLLTALPDAQNDALCTSAAYSFVISATTGKCLVASSAQRAQLGFTGGTRQTLIFPYYRDWDPRFGFALRPLNSDRVVLRGGFGMFTDLPNFNNQHFVDDNPINGTSQIYNTALGSPVPLTNGVPTTTENVFASAGIPLLSQQFESLYVSPNYKDPTILEWSFGIQSQLAPALALEVDYVGNRGYYEGNLHLFANQPEPGTGALQPRRPFPDFNQILWTTPDAESIYNSLQVKLTKQFSRGFTFLSSYTWGNVFDDNEGDEGFGGGIGNSAPQNDNCLKCSWGQSYSNAHQRFVLSGIWELPVGQGMHFLSSSSGLVNELLGGWRASGIYSYQTGFPFTATSGVDYSNSGSGEALPDRVCNGNNGPQTVAKWFNTSCFTTAPLEAALTAGTPMFGNEARNPLIGPPFNDLDFALLKEFKLSERFNLEFRAEFYDFLNTPSFGNPGATVNTSTFGQITSTANPDTERQVQLALKLLF
jgi:hypothetical protein